MWVVVEIMLHIVEYPIAMLVGWTVLSWYTCNSFLGFLVWTPSVVLILLAALLAYLFGASRWYAGKKELPSTHRDWIEIVAPELQKYAGQKLPMREAYEWYFQGKINFSKPLLEVFLNRYNLF